MTVEGGEPFLYLNLTELEFEPIVLQARDQPYVESTIEFPVQKSINGSQCFYHIHLVIWINK